MNERHLIAMSKRPFFSEYKRVRVVINKRRNIIKGTLKKASIYIKLKWKWERKANSFNIFRLNFVDDECFNEKCLLSYSNLF